MQSRFPSSAGSPARSLILAILVVSFSLLTVGESLAAILRVASWNMANRPNDATQESQMSMILQAMGTETVQGNAARLGLLSMSETDPTSAEATAATLNTLYAGSSYQAVYSNPDGGSDRTGFVYDTTMLALESVTELSTAAGLTHNILRGEFSLAGAADDLRFFMYSIHLKSGGSSADENQRLAEADFIRADGDLLGEGVNIIYGGDFNWSSSDERGTDVDSAWDAIVSAGEGQGFDAYDTTNVNGAGDWRDNPDFVHLHTQDPGAAMDDRFDMHFFSDEWFDGMGLELIQDSFRVFGNDGMHMLNGPITSGMGASPEVLLALAGFSDHLPVVSDFQYSTQAVPEPPTVILFAFVLVAFTLPPWLKQRWCLRSTNPGVLIMTASRFWTRMTK